MKTTLVGIALAVSTLASSISFAHDSAPCPPAPPPGQAHQPTYQQPVAYGRNGHGHRRGYYETRYSRQWVNGYRVRSPYCFANAYDRRCYVQGHWESVPTQVWVATRF